MKNYFAFDGDQIKDIKVPADPTDLIKQEELTRSLLKLQPVYDNCEKDTNDYLELISRTLGLPIALTSFGPTALEKEPHDILFGLAGEKIKQTKPDAAACFQARIPV